MGVASLIIGIIAFLVSFIPLVGFLGAILAFVGLILGIVGTVQKAKAGESKGASITGVVFNCLAFVICIVWLLVFAEAADELSHYDSYDSYNYDDDYDFDDDDFDF